MNSDSIDFQVNKILSYFINMDNETILLIIGVLVVILIVAILMKALKSVIALILVVSILVGGSWVKTSIIDVNHIRINDTYIEINGNSFELKNLNGFEVDKGKSELIVKTENGDIGIKIDSNLDGVNKLLKFIGN